jgi:uncharacterized membrane protein YhaH (DUF805 family)
LWEAALGFVDAVKLCFARYATFTGRSARPEFWWWVLFSFLVNIVVGGLLTASGGDWLGALASLALLVPSLAVGARRLHDTGRSGWWQAAVYLPGGLSLLGGFFFMIGLIGMLVMIVLLIVWLLQPGEPGPNGYGAPPSALA